MGQQRKGLQEVRGGENDPPVTVGGKTEREEHLCQWYIPAVSQERKEEEGEERKGVWVRVDKRGGEKKRVSQLT